MANSDKRGQHDDMTNRSGTSAEVIDYSVESVSNMLLNEGGIGVILLRGWGLVWWGGRVSSESTLILVLQIVRIIMIDVFLIFNLKIFM